MNISIAPSRTASLAAALALALQLAAVPRVALAQAAPASDARPARQVDAVQSKDGTSIAYEQTGAGPALVLIAPALSDRSGGARLASLLAAHFTVINFDRRGRGGSGDTPPYSVEREIEDIEALIDKAGGSAALFGSSSGAALALEAATKLTNKVTALILFEPPYLVDDSRAPIREDLFKDIAALVNANRRGDAVALFMTDAIGVPPEMLDQMKQAPMWAAMEKLAHTIPCDGAILAGLLAGKPLPRDRWTSLTARTLLIDGENSDAFLRNAVQALTAVLPNSTRVTLAGQDHSAVFTAPQALVPALTGFLGAAAAPKPVADRVNG